MYWRKTTGGLNTEPSVVAPFLNDSHEGQNTSGAADLLELKLHCHSDLVCLRKRAGFGRVPLVVPELKSAGVCPETTMEFHLSGRKLLSFREPLSVTAYSRLSTGI